MPRRTAAARRLLVATRSLRRSAASDCPDPDRSVVCRAGCSDDGKNLARRSRIGASQIADAATAPKSLAAMADKITAALDSLKKAIDLDAEEDSHRSTIQLSIRPRLAFQRRHGRGAQAMSAHAATIRRHVRRPGRIARRSQHASSEGRLRRRAAGLSPRAGIVRGDPRISQLRFTSGTSARATDGRP